MQCPADMRKWSTGKTFCQQVVILVNVCSSNMDLFKCSTHFVRHHSFVTVAVISGSSLRQLLKMWLRIGSSTVGQRL